MQLGLGERHFQDEPQEHHSFLAHASVNTAQLPHRLDKGKLGLLTFAEPVDCSPYVALPQAQTLHHRSRCANLVFANAAIDFRKMPHALKECAGEAIVE